MAEYSDIINGVDSSLESFDKEALKAQKRIMEKIQLLAKDLEVDSAGNIKTTIANLKKINSIKAEISRIVCDDRYKEAVTKFCESFQKVYDRQNKYYKEHFAEATLSETAAKKQKLLGQMAIDNTIEGLTGAGVNAQITDKLTDMLKRSVTSGALWTDMVAEMRSYLDPDGDGIGAFAKYAKTYATTAMGQFTGQNNKLMTDALDTEWFMYVGSDIETTREFCQHLTKKKYIHVSEIPEILKGHIDGHDCAIYAKTGLPQGMIEGTTPENFQVNVGGWNCRHQLLPVAEEAVPEDIRRKFQQAQEEPEITDFERYMQKYGEEIKELERKAKICSISLFFKVGELTDQKEEISVLEAKFHKYKAEIEQVYKTEKDKYEKMLKDVLSFKTEANNSNNAEAIAIIQTAENDFQFESLSSYSVRSKKYDQLSEWSKKLHKMFANKKPKAVENEWYLKNKSTFLQKRPTLKKVVNIDKIKTMEGTYDEVDAEWERLRALADQRFKEYDIEYKKAEAIIESLKSNQAMYLGALKGFEQYHWAKLNGEADWKKKMKALKELPEKLQKVKEEHEKLFGKNASTGVNESDVMSDSTEFKQIIQRVYLAGVKYNQVQEWKESPTDTEIVEKIAGGDMTEGSCASVAFAYVGCKAGLNVEDYRGGKSRQQFSSRDFKIEFAEKVGGKTEESTNDVKGGNALLSQMVIGKEYYFCCGCHAAIVRKTSRGMEYLELQSATQNGWTLFDEYTLQYRFGAKKINKRNGYSFTKTNVLIDIELIKRDPEFRRMLGYINTAQGDQYKGKTGSIK